MANFITSSRILFSIAMLFFPVFSPVFYVLYCLAGVTDMIDGTVARKTNTVSEFGSKLDTAADIVFVAVCLIKFLPHLTLSAWLCIWICGIACLKVFNMIYGCITQKKLVAEHTVMNKVVGAVLFALPFTLSVVDINLSGNAVCIIATVAAVHEAYLIIKKHKSQKK